MTRKLIGIEIGSTYIKMIETERKKTRIKIKKFSLLNTPPNCIRDGMIYQIVPIKQVILEEFKKKRYTSKQVIVVVQSSQIIVRNLTLEKQSEKMARPWIQMQMEALLPIQKNEYELDFKKIGALEEAGVIKDEWMLIAAPHIIILPVMGLIKALKLKPEAITISSEAVCRLFHAPSHTYNEELDATLVLDIGGQSTTVTILTGEKTYLTRMIGFGVAHLEKINDEEAYFSKVVRPQIEYNILSEVERILQFYYSTKEAKYIKRVYLIGGGAQIEGMEGYIRDALNLPVESRDFLESIIDLPSEAFKKQIHLFMNVLGAVYDS